MRRLFIGLLAGFVVALSMAAPASAANELGVSNDGTTWSSSLPNPLFDNDIRWVPGNSRNATFYVRNQSADYGNLTIDILGDHAGTLLDLGDLHIAANGGGGTSTPVSDGAEHRLLMASGIPSGGIVPINITVDFDDTSANESQLLSTDLNFRVALSHGGSLNDNVSGALPNTGAPEITWIIVIGSIFLGTGIAAVSRRRQNSQGEFHV